MKKEYKAKESIRLREKQLKNGNRSLYLACFSNGKYTYEFLKLYLIPERTREDKERNRETYDLALRIKAKRILEHRGDKYGLGLKSGGKLLLSDLIRQESMKSLKRGGKAYAETLDSLRKHLEHYKSGAVRLEDVDKKFVAGFIEHLNTPEAFIKKQKDKTRVLAEITQCTYVTALSGILNKAVRENYIAGNPLHKINPNDKPAHVEANRAHLELSEIEALARAECPNETTKRAFLFACFCGLRLSDIQTLTWAKVSKSDDGKMRVETAMKKTKDPIYIPLSDNALMWLPERGESKDSDLVFSGLPKKFGIAYDMKVWTERAGIMKHVTFHVSRHTFATLALTYDVPLPVVQKLLGHKKISTTQIYAKIIDKKVSEAVDKIPALNINGNEKE